MYLHSHRQADTHRASVSRIWNQPSVASSEIRKREEAELARQGQEDVLPESSRCRSPLSSPVLRRSGNTGTPARQPIGSSLDDAPPILLQLPGSVDSCRVLGGLGAFQVPWWCW